MEREIPEGYGILKNDEGDFFEGTFRKGHKSGQGIVLNFT